jgi:acyl-CoA thioester hydrolase
MPVTPRNARLVKRKLAVQPRFHEVDLMGVVHNSVYFLWFEEGRLRILFDLLPLDEAIRLQVALPVVENVCRYHQPVRFGDPLVLFTSHLIVPVYEGRLVFQHSLVHENQKIEMASGQSSITLVDARTNQLLKAWPAGIWQRYQTLT